LAYALRYAQLGFRVIPLKERDKRPLIEDWPNKATTDEATIRGWWRKWPKANIGIATGRYGGGYFCVLDFDPRNGGNWYDDVGEDTLPPTWVVHTGGGGRHYYYKTRELLPSAKLPDGVDLKGDGGLVVVPPSIHPKGGEYVWQVGGAPSECPLATLPEWAEAFAVQDEGKHYTMAPPIPEGYRYHFTKSLMGLLLAKGGAMEKVTEFILANREWLFEHGEKPFTEREIRAVGRWLSKKAPGRPVKRWRPVLEKAGVAKQVIEAWASYIGEPNEPPEPDRAKGGKMTREKIAKLLEAAEWVKFRGDVWLTLKGQLYALSEAHEYVYDVSGKTASQQTAKEVAMSIRRSRLKTAPPIDRAVVLYDDAPIFGRAAGYEGVWLAAAGKIWVVTKDGYKTWPLEKPPDGVYYRPDRVLPLAPVLGPEGLRELRIYWGRLTKNLDEGEKGPELSLAALAPVLLGLCNLGVFFTGEKGSGKSTAAKAALLMVYGREPITGIGDTNRDRLSVADADRIFYADDIDITDAEMQKIMRIGLTGGLMRVRKLYEDKKNEVMGIDGSYFLCGIEAKGLRADTLERFISLRFSPKVRIPESKVMEYFAENWHKALGGLLTLYQRAASLPEPDLSAWGWVRPPEWLRWAFRFAEVLKVGEEFREWVLKVRGAAMTQAKFGELAAAIIAGRIKEGVAYKARTLAEILWPDLAMGGKGQSGVGAQDPLYGKERSISSPSGRKALADIAQSCGLRLRMQKVKVADGSTPWEYVFEKAAFEQGWEVPENTLEALCDGVHGPLEGVGEAPAEPLPKNGQAPIPEVPTPPPVPQIAPPAPEPVPMAAKSSPAPKNTLLDLPRSLSEVKQAVRKAPPVPEPAAVAGQDAPAAVGDGVPMAPLPPNKALAIALQAARTPDPSLPMPEKNERGMAVLREALTRLPKPGGLLRQRGTPIEGAPPVPLPPELTEYLRAMAGTLAAEGAMAAEKGRGGEAGALWAAAGEYLVHLAFFDPTREVIAALFLARAADRALVAAQSATQMGEVAGLLAKVAEAVFFGKAAPDVLLEVLLEAPYPTEYDPCLAPSYREAAGCLVAAHWVLTGGDPKRLNRWFLPGRWERDDAEAMLLFSLGSEKKAVADAHLYLGDLPF
jgi:hypothetical protein